MSVAPDTVWYTRCPAPTPLSIAYQLGWIAETFQRHGISVSSIRDSRDPAVRQSHFDHRLDWSFRHGGSIPPIWARASGRETRLVGLTSTDEFQAIIALPDSGVRATGDLIGKRVGIPRRQSESIDFQRATALKGLVSALSLEGLGAQDVEIVYLDSFEPVLLEPSNDRFLGLKRRYPYGDEIAALHRGEVDAVFVKGAEGVGVANLIGATIVAEFGFHPDPKVRVNNGTPRPLTVDALFHDTRPDLVADLVAAIDRAGRWAEAHPGDAVRFIAREIGVSEDAVLAANGPEVHRHLGISLETDQIAAIAHFKDFLLEWGFVPADFNVDDWVAREPFDAVSRRIAA